LIACLCDLPDVVINGELVVLNDMGALLFDRLRWRALMLKDRGSRAVARRKRLAYEVQESH
jgi:hypothetical protein